MTLQEQALAQGGALGDRPGQTLMHMAQAEVPMRANKQKNNRWVLRLWKNHLQQLERDNQQQDELQASIVACRRRHSGYYWPYTPEHVESFLVGCGAAGYSIEVIGHTIAHQLLQIMVDEIPHLTGQPAPPYLLQAIDRAMDKIRRNRPRETASSTKKIGKAACIALDVANILAAAPASTTHYEELSAIVCIAAITGMRAVTAQGIRLADIHSVRQCTDDPSKLLVRLNMDKTKSTPGDWYVLHSQ
jgi:hypothetical protein